MSLRRSAECASESSDVHRNVDEIGVAVIRLAVGEGELHGLGHEVDELRPLGVELADIEALQDRERLEEGRPLPPRPGLADVQSW